MAALFPKRKHASERKVIGIVNILHVISSMSQEAGGPPAVVAGLARALHKRGHAVTIATLGDKGGALVPTDQAVTVRSFPGDGRGYGYSAGLESWLNAEAKRFDLVHLHGVWQFPTFAAARACWAAGVPYVVAPHGMLDEYSVGQHSTWKKRAYWLWREGRVARCAAGLHCLNHAEIRRAVPWVRGIPKFVAPNGIARGEIEAMPERGAFRTLHPEIGDRPMALFLSRLHPKKGLDRLLPAWKEVAGTMPEVRLVLAGTGEAGYVSSLDRLIVSSGLEGKVARVGQLVGRAKWEALVDSDLFVLPSHQEGFSMAITEALAAGRACVITRECNFDEVEEAGCGTVVDGGEMSTFVRGAMALLADAGQRARYGAAGRQLVERLFTWKVVAEHLEQVYQWIRAGKRLLATGEDVWRGSDAKSATCVHCETGG
jgi:glycosyltransferase involved in cell wall biosynthesis